MEVRVKPYLLSNEYHWLVHDYFCKCIFDSCTEDPVTSDSLCCFDKSCEQVLRHL